MRVTERFPVAVLLVCLAASALADDEAQIRRVLDSTYAAIDRTALRGQVWISVPSLPTPYPWKGHLPPRPTLHLDQEVRVSSAPLLKWARDGKRLYYASDDWVDVWDGEVWRTQWLNANHQGAPRTTQRMYKDYGYFIYDPILCGYFYRTENTDIPFTRLLDTKARSVKRLGGGRYRIEAKFRSEGFEYEVGCTTDLTRGGMMEVSTVSSRPLSTDRFLEKSIVIKSATRIGEIWVPTKVFSEVKWRGGKKGTPSVNFDVRKLEANPDRAMFTLFSEGDIVEGEGATYVVTKDGQLKSTTRPASTADDSAFRDLLLLMIGSVGLVVAIGAVCLKLRRARVGG